MHFDHETADRADETAAAVRAATGRTSWAIIDVDTGVLQCRACLAAVNLESEADVSRHYTRACLAVGATAATAYPAPYVASTDAQPARVGRP